MPCVHCPPCAPIGPTLPTACCLCALSSLSCIQWELVMPWMNLSANGILNIGWFSLCAFLGLTSHLRGKRRPCPRPPSSLRVHAVHVLPVPLVALTPGVCRGEVELLEREGMTVCAIETGCLIAPPMCAAMLSNPGAVPLNAKPLDVSGLGHQCSRCRSFKPPRAHHCR